MTVYERVEKPKKKSKQVSKDVQKVFDAVWEYGQKHHKGKPFTIIVSYGEDNIPQIAVEKW